MARLGYYRSITSKLPNGLEISLCASTRGFESLSLRQQKTHFCLQTKVRFLNDVCLRQMMLALPMMTASPNEAWLRHILWQTSHHCDQREQHHFERSEKHHIAVGDASFDKQPILWYNSDDRRCSYERKQTRRTFNEFLR